MTLANANTDPTSFIYPESKLKVSMDLVMPLDISFNKLKLKDTFNLNSGKLVYYATTGMDSSNSTFESGVLYFRNLNGFPFDFNFSAKLLDADKNLVIDLFSNIFIKAADVNSSEVVSSPVQTLFSMPITSEMYYNLKKTKFIEVVYQIDNQTNPKNYKIYNTYNLDFKVSGDIKMKKKF